MSETELISPKRPAERMLSAELRRDQFLDFSRWVQRVLGIMVAALLISGLLSGVDLTFIFAGVGVVIFFLVGLARRLARVGHLDWGVYTFAATILLLLGPAPLFLSNWLPVIASGFAVTIILVGLFVSSRRILPTTGIVLVLFLIPILLDHWLPWQRLELAPVRIVMSLVSLGFVGLLVHRLGQNLGSALEASQAQAEELARSRLELEVRSQQLEAGAAELQAQQEALEQANRELAESIRLSQRRAARLQAGTEVSRVISRIQDLDQLLSEVVELISHHFGFYHVGVFLIDETGLNAVLRAANSEGGKRMLARGHRLGVGTTGIVGFVTSTSRPRIAFDVGMDFAYFDNPDLPETRSEMAVPLESGGQTIGALDLQSTEPNAFSEEDVTVLSALADQISVAIENARLLQQTQSALSQAEAVQRRYLRQQWDSYLGRRPAGLASPPPSSEGSKESLS